MEIKSFSAEVVVLGKPRTAHFKDGQLILDGVDFSDVHWLLAVLEGASATTIPAVPSAGDVRVAPREANGKSGPAAPVAEVVQAEAPKRTRGRTATAELKVPDALAPKDPAGLAPIGLDPDKSPDVPFPTTPVLQPVAAVANIQPAAEPATSAVIAPVSDGGLVEPLPLDVIAGMGIDVKRLKETATLTAMLEYVLGTGVKDDAVIKGIFEGVKGEVGILSRMRSVSSRVEATLKVIRGNVAS